MRKIHRRAQVILASCMMLSSFGPALAQTTSSTPSFSLPGVTLPSGTDEVRAADGTSCRSAIGHAGAYLDVGVIGNPSALTGSSSDSEASSAAYGRLVIPLGRSRKRVDCTRLYDIEVRRLEMELRLMEMGLGRPVENAAADASATSEDDFSDDGWSTDGLDEN